MIKIIVMLIIIVSTSLTAQSNVPEWAKGIVWYQIFPERFANGDKTNDPTYEKVFRNESKKVDGWKITEWTGNWFAQDDWEKDLSNNFRDNLFERRYGGDLQGIINKLDYLKDLGIGAIYLNPVFEAVSLHKYDGSTFHHIDVNFGPDPENDLKIMEKEIPEDNRTWKWTEADNLFLTLIQEVHQRGMKIIIDGVFNHVGVQFWAFQDLISNQEKSKYKDWFIVKSFDDPSTELNEFDYKGWWGIKSLPEFNRNEKDLAEGPKKYIFASTLKWMDPNGDGDPSDGIDGWRLDVAREVPIGFWRDWSKMVKSINPNSIIVGELWELSPDFISENGVFDALMNYNFAFAANDFFISEEKKINADKFIEKLSEINENYPEENLFVLQNLLTSHDTERLSSIIKNPDRKYDSDGNEQNRNYDPSKPSDENYKKQKLIAAFQMFYLGSPMIYYGDEVGMWGADDPHCRKPMIWNEFDYKDEIISEKSGFKKGFGSFKVKSNEELLSFYKEIIALHNKEKALSKGNLNFIFSDNQSQTFAFERIYKYDRIICIFNTGENEYNLFLPITGNNFYYKELFNGESGELYSAKGEVVKLETNLEANSFKIFKVYQK